MGSCTRRHFLLSTCFLQLITIIERQVFDFLGYMWAPILANFFHIIFVIFGFYGAYHFRAKYIVTYLIWSFIWIGWNAFLICFYLDVGILDKNSDILNLGTGSVSWFEVNGFGCKPTYPTNITSEDPYRPVRPERVDDCILDYPIIEIIHSGVQCILAGFGILGGGLLAYIFIDEDDRFDFMGGDAKSPQHTSVHPMYVSYTSIPTTASATLLSNKTNQSHNQNQNQNQNQNNSINKKSLQNYHNINNNYNKTNNIHNNQHQTIINNDDDYNNDNINQYYDDSTAIADQKFTTYNNQNQNQTQNPNQNYKRSITTANIVHPSSSAVSLHKYSINKNSRSISSNNSNSNNTYLDTATTNSNSYSKIHQQFCSNSSSSNSNINKRPDIKYTQISTTGGGGGGVGGSSRGNIGGNVGGDNSIINYDDQSIDDELCLQTFNAVNSGNCSYVPFQNPVPTSFLTNNNNNNNMSNSGHFELSNNMNPIRDNSQALINGNDNDYENNYGYSIPIGSITTNSNNNNSNNSSNHFIRQYQRSGRPPYPDLSPEVTEKYSMPYQIVPKSPVMSRISVRRRQDRSQVANFCDQIRNAPPGYNDVAPSAPYSNYNLMSRAKSHDRLSSSNTRGNNNNNNNTNMSRLSNGSNRSQKPRPRSYCNSNSNSNNNFIPINYHYQPQHHHHQQHSSQPQTIIDDD